jgi:hypothetical protein
VDDASRIEAVDRGHQRTRILEPELPATSQVGRALQRPVLPAFGEPGDLSRSARVLADSETLIPRLVRVTQRVSMGRNRAYDHLAEAATFWRVIHPRREGLAGAGSDVLGVS